MGVACRDIKLENVLVDNSFARPILKLADFGLSLQCGPDAPRAGVAVAAAAGGQPGGPAGKPWGCPAGHGSGSSSASAKSEGPVGTLSYMAPELLVACKERPADAKVRGCATRLAVQGMGLIRMCGRGRGRAGGLSNNGFNSPGAHGGRQ